MIWADPWEMRLPRSLVAMAADDVYVLQSLGPTVPWRYPTHHHDGWSELQFLVEGELRQQVNGRDEDLAAGDVLLVRREDQHSLGGRNFVLFNLLVPDAEWIRLATYLGDADPLATLAAPQRPPRLHLTGVERERLEADLRLLFARQGTPGARALLGRLLLDLLPRLMDERSAAPTALAAPSASPPWLRRLLEDLDNLLDRGADTAELARQAGIGAEHLARSVRKHLGITPTELLGRRRLERAALLLSHSDRPVLSIALDLGYGSASVFSRAFRQQHGLSPRAWRKRHGVGWRA